MPRRNRNASSRPGRTGNKTARLERQLLEMQRAMAAAQGLWPDTGEDPQGPGDDEAAGHHQVAAARAGETGS